MGLKLDSRKYKELFVSASLIFIVWLCTSLWLDAFHYRSDARRIKAANEKENVLTDLADGVSDQRNLFYQLYNAKAPDKAALADLKSLSNTNQSELVRNIGILNEQDNSAAHNHSEVKNTNSAMKTHNSTHNKNEDIRTEHSAVTHSSETKKPASENVHAHHLPSKQVKQPFNLEEISQKLISDNNTLFKQLNLPREHRKPGYGMSKFHDYTMIIESLDTIRRTLHVIPKDSKREFYTHAKLKDTIWNLRESLKQMASLIEGIHTLSGIPHELTQTRHNADMLMELNVRVNMALNDILKVSNSSDNQTLLDNASLTSIWYTDNFKAFSTRLSASSRYETVTQDELVGWLGLIQQLLQRTENIQMDAKVITLNSVKSVELHATRKLVLISVLLLFAVGMSISSFVFFRRVNKQAHQDELTGLDNRRMFSLNLDKSISAAKNAETDIGIIMIDLDQFKYTNDTMGHMAGDSLLQKVSSRLKEAAEDCWYISRLGGDEFVILLPGASSSKSHTVAKTVRDLLMQPFDIEGATANIGSSIGIAMFPRDATTQDSLIQAADIAMYSAKKSGTNLIIEYDNGLEQSTAGTAKLVTELKTAIQERQFELYYQPQFDLVLSRVTSVEALIRWNHPERGFVSPFDFIPAAEENGLMPAIGSWVIEEACKQASYWLHTDKMPLRVAVNISADHFFQPDFVKSVIDNLEKYELPAQYIELEVTESVAVNDMNVVVNSLKKLRESSIQVALDDFGTGYSSLSYLQDLPLDTLKIDKTFIQKMCQGNSQHDSITETIASLGRTLSLSTVAEGVETKDQLTAVADMQISLVQGYYYSKPVAAHELPMVVQQINNANEKQKAA